MKHYLYLLVFIFAFNYVYAVDFTATVDKDYIEVGDQFTVTFSIDGDGSDFKAPSFANFKVLAGPSQSQSIQIINGKMSRSLTFSYVLQAVKEGKFTIGPARITSKGNEISSNSIEIVVAKPSQAKLDQMKQEQNAESQLQKQASDIINKNIDIKVTTDKTNAYIGEPILATYKIYMHPELAVTQISVKKSPQLDGFWTQDFDLGQIQYKFETINGKTYRTAVVKKAILFPQQSGKLSVDSYEFDVSVRLQVQDQKKKRNRDPFADFFDNFFNDPFSNTSYREFQTTVKSPAISINVKDLPKNAPVSFTGAVGNFAANSWIDRNKAKTGEAITYRLKIAGKGNFQLIQPPKLDLPPSFEVYDPKIVNNTKLGDNNVEGDLIFEYVIIPQTPGNYKIPAIDFSYFDLNSKEYKTIKTAEQSLEILQGTTANYSANGTNKEDVKLLNQDIQYIKTSIGKIEQDKSHFFPSIWFYILLILPLFAWLAALYFKNEKQQLMNNQAELRRRQARKIAEKQLKDADKYLQLPDLQKFIDEISKALWGFAANKLSIPPANLSRDNIESIMRRKNVKEELIAELINLLDECEFARFAPSQLNGNLQSIYQKAIDVITHLEEEIK